MSRACFVPALALLALLAGCSSEDPRLPTRLYEDALKLNQEGRSLEAQAMMKQLVARYPDSEAAHQATRDLFLIEAFVNRDLEDRRKQVRAALKRLTDALIRYKAKTGEYPETLQGLVPEYLEQVPEAPWGHPFLYRPYVARPVEDVQVKRGPVRQKFNTKLDGYYLACLGTDGLPGGEGLAGDILIKDGAPWTDGPYPPVPQPQPVR
ncbi:type II secretion system protein GspG [Geothrix campi]|uniref:type II secretion system protein GspG n=1 Tax=Geothrix campi TaxID=2966450 RepID=UPI0021487123